MLENNWIFIFEKHINENLLLFVMLPIMTCEHVEMDFNDI